MAKFCELGVDTDIIVGKGIEIEELFDRRILIEKTKIQATKFPGKNASGLRMQMQVVLATFNESPDENGDYFVKKPDGSPVGERRSCFTGSDILISQIQKAEAQIAQRNKDAEESYKTELSAAADRSQVAKPHFLHLYPMDTTIVKIGKCFQFT